MDILISHNCTGWEQGRSRLAPIGGLTGFNQIVQDVAMLLFQGCDHRHNPFSKETTRLALGAETALAPQHAGSDQAFGQVIGWLNSLDPDKSPEGSFSFEDVSTGRRRFRVGTTGALAQQFTNFGLKGLHLFLKSRVGQGTIANFRPPVKDQAGLSQEVFPQSLGGATTLDKSLKITQEVGPTELT